MSRRKNLLDHTAVFRHNAGAQFAHFHPGDEGLNRRNPSKPVYQFFAVALHGGALTGPMIRGSLGVVAGSFEYREDAQSEVRELRNDGIAAKVYTRATLTRAGYKRLPTGNFSRNNPTAALHWRKTTMYGGDKAYAASDRSSGHTDASYTIEKVVGGYTLAHSGGGTGYIRIGFHDTLRGAKATAAHHFAGSRANPYVTFTRRRHHGKKLRKPEQISIRAAHTRARRGVASDKPTSKLIRVVNPSGKLLGYAALVPNGRGTPSRTGRMVARNVRAYLTDPGMRTNSVRGDLYQTAAGWTLTDERHGGNKVFPLSGREVEVYRENEDEPFLQYDGMRKIR